MTSNNRKCRVIVQSEEELGQFVRYLGEEGKLVTWGFRRIFPTQELAVMTALMLGYNTFTVRAEAPVSHTGVRYMNGVRER